MRLLPAVLLLSFGVAASVCAHQNELGLAQISAPLFAWSSQGRDGDEPAHVQSFQIHSSLSGILQQLLKGEQGTGGAVSSWLDSQEQPDVVLAVLGTQLRSSHLKTRAMHSSLQPLQSLLDKAASSLSAPYVLHQAAAQEGCISSLHQVAAGMDAACSVVGCSADGASSLEAALQARQQGGRHVVVLCTQSPGAAAAGSPEAVAAELQQLQEAHDKVAQLGKRLLTVYAAVPDAADTLPTRRQLQGVHADVGTCGQLCQTQVKWLEGILAAFILAIAAFSGMCCLYMLDTPTKFEKPKEGARND